MQIMYEKISLDELKKMSEDLIESGRWFKLSFMEQMANIVSDVGRAIQWRAKGDLKTSRHALDRALEQIDK